MGQHGKHRALVSLGAAAALTLWAAAAEAQCRLALVLGLDISSSVDAEEDALQRQGLARALIAPQVVQAATALPGQPVAIAVFEWSGRWQQDLLLDWTMVESAADMERISATIAASKRSYADFPTAMGYALGYASDLLRRAPPCLFRTLDLSGDGINNDGFGPALAYQNFPYEEVTVNGLVVTGHDQAVVTFFEREVRHGPGAFIEVARGFEDFERAMRRKLVRELGARVIGLAE
ncbi:DUF1194 domain-containing protein [Palleronia pelagia]|uniref:VWFA domain-containing protein n=1 Tax=Palleronia pelagia TaxID=387096 RepID=A0A1H8GSV9_9RHOB|nr:DUF1194 domain-containing protein [Palleronia pelagia]SEN46794.1 Protein of unknown function [Palleronia pelagia]